MPRIQFHELLAFDAKTTGARKTRDGYLVASPRVARAGIQVYKGWEVGDFDKENVRVYRPEEEVFHKDAMGSLAFRPITIDHPSENVDSKTWRQYAVGHAAGDVARDGEFLRVPMALMDQDAIERVEKGAAQISLGYVCDLVMGEGTTPSGETFDAKQTGIRINHIALVPEARGGPQLRFGDDRTDSRSRRRTSMSDSVTVAIDGVNTEMTETAAALVARQIKGFSDRTAALATDIAKLTTDLAESKKLIEAKDGEIVVLKKQVTDSKLSPAQISNMVRARSTLVASATKVLGDKVSLDNSTDIEIKRAVVEKALGADATKALSDEGIGGAFQAAIAMLDKGGGTGGGNDLSRLAQNLANPNTMDAQDAALNAWNRQGAKLREAWKNPAKAWDKPAAAGK